MKRLVTITAAAAALTLLLSPLANSQNKPKAPKTPRLYVIDCGLLTMSAPQLFNFTKEEIGEKQPFAVGLRGGGMFGVAGLWDQWKDRSTGHSLETFTIITTDPNPLMEPFHNRMPVIMKPVDYERWMAPADPARLPVDLLRPYPEEEMEAWKVAKAVGNVRNNNPELIAPL